MTTTIHKVLKGITQVALLALALSPFPASATFFNALDPAPLIFDGADGFVEFDPFDPNEGMGTFTAMSYPSSFTMNGTTVEIDAEFELMAYVSTSGVFDSGYFTIMAMVNGMNEVNGGAYLLEGTLTGIMCDGLNFGSQCDVLTTFTGGAYREYFPESGGVLIDNAGFYGSWAENFGSETAAIAVGVPVPEPATIALLSLGLAGLGFTRRRMKA